MKYPEYDSPFELVMSDITTQVAKKIDEECWQAVQRVGINVNKETLLRALEFDSARYREAFRRGEETGYTKRDEEIIRGKDCKFWYKDECSHLCAINGDLRPSNYFCADGERRTDDD